MILVPSISAHAEQACASLPSVWPEEISVIIGALIGGILAVGGELFFRCRDERQAAKFSATNLLALLEKLVSDCALIAADDGYSGPERQGISPSPQVPDPEFF